MPSSQTIRDTLGNPNVVEALDYASILKAMRDDAVARFPAISPYIDLETEPSRIILEVAAYRETLLRARINDAARQSSSYWFASGSTLDYAANFYDVTRMTGETDERLRLRIWLAITGRSTGGTAQRYRLIALEASSDVSDAYVWRADPSPVVNVAIRSALNNGIASPELLTTVRDALNDPRVRMVNDTINVIQSVTVSQPVSANIWLLPSQTSTDLTAIKDGLLAAWAQESSIGFDLSKAWITAKLMQPGIQHVEVLAPTQNIVVSQHEAIAITTVTLNFMGWSF